ncbi:hypothetical protein OSH08_07340 [Kaistia geumhonensis]|uniref:Uncharacterized protein n=1 Tax=Kaistia geumhonensis TaxID=410839 RepID=A0ABU0M560_9HYPH|nr:hypothetical protein [Kaistia geumhonensis]MCX5478811.1 hypothetical protein [Kaistia geumhonensis]MDQ0515970.1 hypothetical protein [Kaistia geumhonensis]
MTSSAWKASSAASPSWSERIAGGIALAATPLFAAMAVASFAEESGTVLCGPMPGTILPGGMGLMYALMSVVHAGAWLRRLARV